MDKPHESRLPPFNYTGIPYNKTLRANEMQTPGATRKDILLLNQRWGP